MVPLNLITAGWVPRRVLAWSGFVASAMLLVSWFNAIATNTLDEPASLSPGPIATVTGEDNAWTRFLRAREGPPCYMFITPSPSPGPSPCEP
jgi:hypothetical protein